jgi:hypothetical protein
MHKKRIGLMGTLGQVAALAIPVTITVAQPAIAQISLRPYEALSPLSKSVSDTSPNVVGVNVLESGVYSAHLKTDLDATKRTTSTGYSLVSSGTKIDHSRYQAGQFDDGLPRVGFWWYVSGSPQGQTIEMTIVQINPDGSRTNTPWTRTLGEKAWNGMRINDWHSSLGRTVFQGWYGDRKLFEVAFDIR